MFAFSSLFLSVVVSTFGVTVLPIIFENCLFHVAAIVWIRIQSIQSNSQNLAIGLKRKSKSAVAKKSNSVFNEMNT